MYFFLVYLNSKIKLHNAQGQFGQIISLSIISICRKRGFKYDLDLQFIKDNIFNNCHYCDSEPSNVYKSNTQEVRTVKYNGLDRKDNSKGYLKDNVVTCCKTCNYMKCEMGYEDFKSHIKNIYKRMFK
jgi:hypothetical protein